MRDFFGGAVFSRRDLYFRIWHIFSIFRYKTSLFRAYVMTIFRECLLAYFVVGLASLAACDVISKEPTVLIAILVRNKAHTLPYFLSLLQRQDYPKQRICLWVRSDNNVDNSIEILTKWINSEGELYHSLNVHLNATSTGFEDEKTIADWSPSRFAHIIDLRERALNHARQVWADFIWMLDADVFLTNSSTLRDLVLKGKTVVAPLLKSDGMYSNFWAGMTAEHYYVRTDRYEPILYREETGCHDVPMIHSAVLIDLRRRDSDRLTYKAEKLIGYDGPVDDIITFAVGANKSDVSLFVCNDEIYGFVMVPLESDESIAEDTLRLTNTKVEMLAHSDYLPLSEDLKQFVTYPEMDTLSLDHIYMINLLRRPERRGRMQRLFKELGIRAEIIDAVDGRTLNESILKEWGVKPMPEYADPYHKRPMTMGEIGCFLSHYVIWQKVLEHGYKDVMVLEDDVRFEPFFRQKVRYVLTELSDLGVEWDLIYLGRKRLMESEESRIQGSKFLVRAAYSYWTLGYVLSESGARKLLSAMPLGKLVPVDEYLPILSDTHPKKRWAAQFPTRDLIVLSTDPLLVHPTHYTGEEGYISDTEDSKIIQDKAKSQTVGPQTREEL
ncbi:PREDICTED: glycosyltransferase 25 family member isoform X2 [Dinoponera quadriceps]|uniref:Glycosyltransferase 25 family member isoform X2 n=1 Tax=Dinoponera quadriceps TaxID=609295 RepID=A0A6P3YAI8_DINQU|nr:PREDICTED: glycosyltransferase 25 family member isoform X2 [Dinoponera quadriceps]